MSHLLEFYGEECPGCADIDKLVKRLEKEEDIHIEQIEVWHNEENMKRMEELDVKSCDGVPFFINIETGETICGEAPYDVLKKWARG